MFTLRAGTHDDIVAVLALWPVAAAEPSSTDDAGSIDALLARSPGALIVAVERDEIVGTIIAGWDGWRGGLYRLAVLPLHRRRGIATALVAAAEEQLRAQGVIRMHLIASRAGGDAAEAFWIAIGYDSTDQVRFVKTFM